MKMNNKGLAPAALLVIGLVLAMIGGGGYYLYKNDFKIPFIQQIAFDPGCKFIPNPSDPNSLITTEVATSNYKCDASECIVQGVLSIDKPSVSNVVSYRGNNDPISSASQIAFAIPGTTVLQSYIRGTMVSVSDYCGSGAPGYLFTLTDFPMQRVHYIDNTLIICAISGSGREAGYKFKLGGTADITNTLKSGELCNKGYIKCSQLDRYDAFWNFVPDGQTSFPQGSAGIKNYFVSSNGAFNYTDEYKLTKDKSVTFDARYGDGTIIPNSLTNKFIRIRKSDCTCNTKVTALSACDPNINKVLCTPESGCPTGYSKVTSGTYVKTVGTNQQCFTATSSFPLCVKGVSTTTSGACTPRGNLVEDAINPTTLYNKYKSCTTTKDTDGCYQWSAIQTATSPMQCYVGNVVGTGLGTLKCDNSCSLGAVKVVGDVSKGEYQVCEKNANNCPVWSTTKFCNPGLYSSLNASVEENMCVCPTIDKENGFSQCITSEKRTIVEPVNIGGKSCLQYVNETTLGEQICSDGIFTCNGVNECTFGQVRCGTTNKLYQKCEKDPNDLINSCYKFRATYPTPDGQLCKNNQLEIDTNQKCFNTPALACITSEGQICDQANPSSLTYGECICDASKYTLASSTNFTHGDQRCYNNAIQEVKVIGTGLATNGVICHEWKNKQICGSEQICIQNSTI